MPNTYTVGLWIDRSGPSRIEVNYLTDPYKDPGTGETHVSTTWAFKLSAANGSPAGSNKGAGAGFGYGFLDYSLDGGEGDDILIGGEDDGSGTKAAAVQFALLDDKAVLTAADFLIV